MSELSDFFLRAQEGDKTAFGELVRRYQDLAVGYAYSLLGDFHLAEDAAQEAFADAYRHIAQVYELRSFPAWLKKVVFKHCDRITRRKMLPLVPLDNAAHVTSDAPDPYEHMEQTERNQMVWAMLSELSDNDRQVMTLYYMSGYPQKEIAAFLDISEPAVRRRLHTARKRFKERMLTMVEDTLQEQCPSRDETFIGNVTGKISGCITGLAFQGTVMPETVFDDINLHKAKYRNVCLSGSHYEDIDHTESYLNVVNYWDSTLERVSFSGAHFIDSGIIKDDRNQTPIRFDDCSFRGSTFTRTDFSEVNLVDCNVEDMKINGIPVSALLEKYEETAAEES